MFERKRVRNICKGYVRKLEIMYNNIGIKSILILLWFLILYVYFLYQQLVEFLQTKMKTRKDIFKWQKRLYAYCELIVF